MTSTIARLYHSYGVTWRFAILASILAVLLAVVSWNVLTYTVPKVVSRLAELDAKTRTKICAHRANSIPMYRQAIQYFDCLEIDVHVNPPVGGPPAVYHPPVENNHGLTLDFLLTHEDLPKGRLWLDVKDLSEDNWNAFHERLVRLIPPDRRGDVIVETVWSESSVRQAATAFRNSGFAFSYYLPTDEAIACGNLRTLACDDFRRQVLSTVEMGFSHLSFDAHAYSFVLSINDELPAKVRLLTWDLSRMWPRKTLLDRVDVYIVTFPSPFAT
ncbi:MAG: hypothetical protein ACREUQ_06450 [Burkholderiales bacterium]